MKKHNGMRPHDIAILLKIAAKGNTTWRMKDLAIELGISASEVSESLNRSAFANLIGNNKKKLMTMALLEFLQYGLKYVFPQHPGVLLRGLPTAWSAAPLSEEIESNEAVVWPYAEGTIRGQAIEPLFTNAPKSCLLDKKFYELMALTDALRIGKARERSIAIKELTKRLE
jgi:hypothetical protein